MKSQPNLMFIHFDSIDDAGHAHQWGSKEYYNAVKVWKYPLQVTHHPAQPHVCRKPTTGTFRKIKYGLPSIITHCRLRGKRTDIYDCESMISCKSE